MGLGCDPGVWLCVWLPISRLIALQIYPANHAWVNVVGVP